MTLEPRTVTFEEQNPELDEMTRRVRFSQQDYRERLLQHVRFIDVGAFEVTSLGVLSELRRP